MGIFLETVCAEYLNQLLKIELPSLIIMKLAFFAINVICNLLNNMTEASYAADITFVAIYPL